MIINFGSKVSDIYQVSISEGEAEKSLKKIISLFKGEKFKGNDFNRYFKGEIIAFDSERITYLDSKYIRSVYLLEKIMKQFGEEENYLEILRILVEIEL